MPERPLSSFTNLDAFAAAWFIAAWLFMSWLTEASP